MSNRKYMPIMGSDLLKAVPMKMLLPHEAQALSNHNQTLERLAQRGGLGTTEALCIILGCSWNGLKPCPHNDGILLQHIAKHLIDEDARVAMSGGGEHGD